MNAYVLWHEDTYVSKVFPVISEGIKTKTQFKKFCFEWGRETRLALDKMKLRDVLISKELDESKFE